VTSGANKTSLLSGEKAKPVPEPGLAKEKKPAVSTSHVVRRKPIVSEAFAAPKIAAPERPSIEVIEGAKKRSVDFP